jgi:serine/threonine protein kinase
LTTAVVPPGFRAPEILLGKTNYGSPVDIWSAACVLYEMATGYLLFAPSSQTNMAQLQSICGSINPADWPELSGEGLDLVHAGRSQRDPLDHFLRERLPAGFEGLRGLLESMLCLNPHHRITAEDALNHPFFGGAQDQNEIEVFPESHREQMRKNKRMRKVSAIFPEIAALARVHPIRV